MSRSTDSIEGNTLREQDLLVLEQHPLLTVRKLLESENLHNMTEEEMSELATELHELIIETRKKLRGVPQSFNTSKDSLLKNLRSASIKLHLAWDQLESKGKTTGYYQHLLACKEYLEKSYEQCVRIIIEGTDNIKNTKATLTEQSNPVSLSIETFLTRMQAYLRELSDAGEQLQQIYELICSDDELWADQCSHAIFSLREMSQSIQDVCTLLNSPVELPPSISQQSYELMVKFYYVDEQARAAASLIVSFQPVCQSKTKQAAKLRGEILQKVHLLKQNYNSILQNMSLFLRKIKSSERLSNGHHGLVLVKTSQ